MYLEGWIQSNHHIGYKHVRQNSHHPKVYRVPKDNLKRIYDILQTKHQPFTKQKSLVHKLENK